LKILLNSIRPVFASTSLKFIMLRKLDTGESFASQVSETVASLASVSEKKLTMCVNDRTFSRAEIRESIRMHRSSDRYTHRHTHTHTQSDPRYYRRHTPHLDRADKSFQVLITPGSPYRCMLLLINRDGVSAPVTRASGASPLDNKPR